jgi:hypothetical protein
MKRCQKSNLRLSVLVSFLLYVACIAPLSYAQKPERMAQAEVLALLKKANQVDDQEASEKVAQELLKSRSQTFPVLLDILKDGKGCIERRAAAQFLVENDPKNEAVVAPLVAISKGRTLLSSEEELLCRRGATFLLAFSTAGIRALTGLLKDKDIFVRRGAIFAFDELTETANYPEGSIQAMKEAIPVIAAARSENDNVLSDMADEVMGQIVRQGGRELSDAAKKALRR